MLSRMVVSRRNVENKMEQYQREAKLQSRHVNRHFVCCYLSCDCNWYIHDE